MTFSFKYRAYQRAMRAIETNSEGLRKGGQNDCRRFVKKTGMTEGGEVADRAIHTLGEEAAAREAAFDGFYGLATSLDGDDVEGILKVNANRRQIEECFRIMKSEFKARPTYLGREDRIRAHFLTCFIALLVYRIVERKLGGNYTCTQIAEGLRAMDFKEVGGGGYEPLYMRAEFTDDLHAAFGFHTDYEIVIDRVMKNIIRQAKRAETLRHSLRLIIRIPCKPTGVSTNIAPQGVKRRDGSSYGCLHPQTMIHIANLYLWVDCLGA